MAPPSSLSFSVTRRKPELLTPAKPTPRELKQLSDIDDQQGHRCQIPVIIFYRNVETTHWMGGRDRHHLLDPVRVIREAVAKALMFYYPLAGRLIEEPNKELTVDCTGEGVLFVEADADVGLDQLGDMVGPPCPYAKEFLYDVPGSGGITECPLLLIQVTRLSCGGFVVAIRLNHAVSDAVGLAQFLKATAEMAQASSSSSSSSSSSPSPPPVWQRELLNARYPPRITCIHHEYEEDLTRSSTNHDKSITSTATAHQSFFFGTKEMRAIFKHLPPPLQSCSPVELLLTACLWRCRTVALQVDSNETVRVTFTVNVRDKPGLHLPPGYYGNSFVCPAAVSNAQMLCENPLGYAVELVKKAEARVTERYIRSVADFLVVNGRPPYSRSWNFIVCDMTCVGFREVDFGWGKPVYGGPVGGTFFSSPYAVFRNGEGEDGIVVPICLPVAAMERFKVELWRMTHEPIEDSHLVKPIKVTSML